MKGRMIVLDHLGDVEVAAMLVDGKLDDLLIDMPDAPRPGAIYRGVCDRPLKGQGGMILRLPDGPGFLRQGKGLAPGDTMLVQITGHAEDGKALPVTPKVLFKSRYAIVTPDAPGWNVSRSIKDDDERERLMAIAHETMDEDMGLILRSSCFGASDDAIADDIAAMADLARAVMADREGKDAETLTDGDGPHAMAWREWDDKAVIETEPGGFEHHGVLDQIEMLKSARENLGGGAFMYVEPTRALVAVDVNTGGDMSPAATLKANLATAAALPRAVRLRGLGGQITVDFAPMSKAHRRQVEGALRAAFRADPIETSLVGWTTLGHFELQRKRERLPLSETLPKGV